MTTEQKIFEELSNLCGSKGFIHVLVKMWFEDNYFRANKKGNFTTSQISEFQANREKLNRNELNTLLALVVKNNPTFSMIKYHSKRYQMSIVLEPMSY